MCGTQRTEREQESHHQFGGSGAGGVDHRSMSYGMTLPVNLSLSRAR
jgi:hypothetical protein